MDPTPFGLSLRVERLELTFDDVVRAHCSADFKSRVKFVELLGIEPKIRAQQAHAGEDGSSQKSLRHVIDNQAAK